jgi:hypothetical protein
VKCEGGSKQQQGEAQREGGSSSRVKCEGQNMQQQSEVWGIKQTTWWSMKKGINNSMEKQRNKKCKEIGAK